MEPEIIVPGLYINSIPPTGTDMVVQFNPCVTTLKEVVKIIAFISLTELSDNAHLN